MCTFTPLPCNRTRLPLTQLGCVPAFLLCSPNAGSLQFEGINAGGDNYSSGFGVISDPYTVDMEVTGEAAAHETGNSYKGAATCAVR